LDLLIESLAAHDVNIGCVDSWLACPREGASGICAHAQRIWRSECLVLDGLVRVVGCHCLSHVGLAEKGALTLVARGICQRLLEAPL